MTDTTTQMSPRRAGSITGAQLRDLQRLLHQAYVAGYHAFSSWDPRRCGDCSMAEASAAIGALRAARSRAWRDDVDGASSPISRWPLDTPALVDRGAA